MAKIGIVSNPYSKEISFFRMSSENEEWEKFSVENASGSRLLSESLSSGVFLFKAAEIVDIIYKEYFTEDERLEIVFEGTDFEFQVLTEICSIYKMSSNIELIRFSQVLPNAYDALNIVSETYDSVLPLLLELLAMTDGSDNPDIRSRSQSIYSSLQRFIDISNNKVPICVFGNHRTDRSIFINALVCCEFLPSDDDNATAYISRISQSKDANSASIHFMCNGVSTDLFITSSSCRLQPPLKQNLLPEDLSCALQTIFQDCNRETVPQTVSRVLKAISNYGKEYISGIVSIEIPFNCASLLYKFPEHIVFYDMPDFSSSVFSESIQNLRKELADNSSGLAIYVAQYSDNIDNIEQLDEIISIETLDKRFNLLVIRESNMLDDKHNEIMLEQLRNQLTVTSNRFAKVISFISPVKGLSSNIGSISTSFSGECCNQELDYIDNISGLFSVKQFISDFASIYYPCSKYCFSSTSLSNIIDEAISLVKDFIREKEKPVWQDNLAKLQSQCSATKDAFLKKYKDYMQTIKSMLIQSVESSANFDFAFVNAPDDFNTGNIMINGASLRRLLCGGNLITQVEAMALNNEFNSEFKGPIFNYSCKYLNIIASDLKEELEQIIYRFEILNNDQKSELYNVILNYNAQPNFKPPKSFNLSDLAYIPSRKKCLISIINNLFASLFKSHVNSFEVWYSEFINNIFLNMNNLLSNSNKKVVRRLKIIQGVFAEASSHLSSLNLTNNLPHLLESQDAI